MERIHFLFQPADILCMEISPDVTAQLCWMVPKAIFFVDLRPLRWFWAHFSWMPSGFMLNLLGFLGPPMA